VIPATFFLFHIQLRWTQNNTGPKMLDIVHVTHANKRRQCVKPAAWRITFACSHWERPRKSSASKIAWLKQLKL